MYLLKISNTPIAHTCNYRYLDTKFDWIGNDLTITTIYKCDYCGKDRIEVFNKENTAIKISIYKVKLLNEKK